MKTSLTLSTVLFALSLTPAAFANGAQDQTQESATTSTATSSTSVTVASTEAPEATSVTRSVLQQLEIDVRENVLGSLRSSTLLMEALQFAAPALVEATGINQNLDLTAR